MINEKLTQRVREALAEVPKVKEKKMFRGITFMVNGKMCISVGNEEIMCRIDPEIFDEALKKNGARPWIHADHTMRAFVLLLKLPIQPKKNFNYCLILI